MAPMGKGHGNDGRPFDIETACYLKPVLLGIQRESTRKCVIKAGVKTMKTFCVEMAAAYYTAYGAGDATLYLGTGDELVMGRGFHEGKAADDCQPLRRNQHGG